MKTQFEKDLYKAFIVVAEKYGDEVFKMSCYAKYGVFAHKVKEKDNEKES